MANTHKAYQKKDPKIKNQQKYKNVGREIAKKLKVEDFGTLEEIKEKAKPIRSAKSKEEMEPILDSIMSKGILKSADGIEATISGKSKREILSEKYGHKALGIEAHWEIVANIDKLYSNAKEKEPVRLNPHKKIKI